LLKRKGKKRKEKKRKEKKRKNFGKIFASSTKKIIRCEWISIVVIKHFTRTFILFK